MTDHRDGAPLKHMEAHYKQLLEYIGEDTSQEGLARTPHRAAKSFLESTQGYQQDISEILNDAIFESDMDEMILVKDIELFSTCEHHILPFFGKCHVGYIPNGKILGLSKVARIVDVFAKRLQIQEQLTHQIADAIESAVQAKGVAVVIEAQHFCMMMRGVQKQNSVMKTSRMLGVFRSKSETRAEFF